MKENKHYTPRLIGSFLLSSIIGGGTEHSGFPGSCVNAGARTDALEQHLRLQFRRRATLCFDSRCREIHGDIRWR